ncbi:MAG TPA: DNA repair protein RadC [Syntrophales bacterium]|nr:DNA repair protein RadC [Syntrophales bacterium]HNS54643.1 DNA repair protein RadC [Syntrophales bacterium]
MNNGEPHHLGHRERLKARFERAGISGLQEYEVLELLLFYALPRRDVKPLAKELLKRFGSLKGVLDADREALQATPGIGRHAAVLVGIVREVAALSLRQRAEEREQISSTKELIDYCLASMGGLKDEHFAVICLNARNRIIQVETVQEGIVNQAVVYPRKVLEKALAHKASAIILVHNHPSGHVRPSDADIRLTRVLQDAARVMDIALHDHLIVGGNRFFSFREEGIL